VDAMIAIHTFTIHAECPFVEHKQWDYYAVEVQTEDVVDVHFLESVMDQVRGLRTSQEEIAELIKRNLSCEAIVTVTGKHSQNSATKVMA
jgi:hypothetical protein